MIQKHFEYTGSKRAEHILQRWEKEKEHFWKIIPGEYKKALARMEKEEAAKKVLDNEIVLDEVHNG